VACLGRDGARATASPLGVVQILSGCLVWGVFVAHVGSLQDRCGVALTTSAGMLVAALCSAGESAWNGTLGTVLAPGEWAVLPVAGLVLLSTVVPSFLTQNGLHRLGPVRMGILSLAGPALVPFLAAAFLGERMSLPQVAGLAVVVVASVPLGFARSRSESAPD
jgi:threonine/homoserine efflux transporter RhtA